MVKKNALILALVLAAALVLTGCGSEEPQTGTVEALATQAVAEAPENPLSLGRMEGGTYTNTYAGFGCDLDESWQFLGAEELQEVPDSVQDAMDGSELAEKMKDIPTLMDMQAQNAEKMIGANVVYTKQDMASRLAAQTMSEEDLIDQMLQQKDMLVESYTQAGIDVVSIEKVQVNFLGEEHYAMKTAGSIQDVPYYALQVFNYRVGAYGVTLTASSFAEDNTLAVLDLFYPVN